MELHTTLGSECLAAIQEQLGEDDFLELAQEIAAAHHEKWDGSGYPHALRGKGIPLAARIVALADVYDALTSARAYKEPLSHAEAREWIVTSYAAHFDPEVVEAFVARDSEFARIASEQASESTAEAKKLAIEEKSASQDSSPQDSQESARRSDEKGPHETTPADSDSETSANSIASTL